MIDNRVLSVRVGCKESVGGGIDLAKDGMRCMESTRELCTCIYSTGTVPTLLT
jgi:hypothetical protein